MTADEIAGVSIFAGLSPPSASGLPGRRPTSRSPRASSRCTRATSGRSSRVLEGRIEAVRSSTGSRRVVGERIPGDVFGEVPIALGTLSRRVSRGGALAGDPDRAGRLPRARRRSAGGRREVGSWRPTGSAGRGLQARRGAAPAAGDRPRASRDASCAELRRFLDRNQITFRWLQPDVPADAEQWWGAAAGRGRLPRDSRRRRHHGRATAASAGRRAPRHRDRAGGRGVRHGHRRRGARRPRSRRVRRVRGPADDRDRARGAGGQAGTSSRIENYLGFPSGVSGDELASRALQQARRLGAEILVTRSITRIDPATRQVHLDGGDVLRARTIILACGVSWRHLSIEGFDRLAGKGVFYGAARSEAANTHGLDVHIVGAGNSAGQAAMFFSDHARSVTILCRGESLEKSMSRYLIDQLATRPNIDVRTGPRWPPRTATVARGDRRPRRATGETTRLASGGLFIFIGADAETAWLPPEIALDEQRLRAHRHRLRAAGRWTLDRDPYLLETSVPGIFACGDVRFEPREARRRRRRRGQHGDRLRPPVPEGR